MTDERILVTPDGVARVERRAAIDERLGRSHVACAAILSAAAPPPECGPEIPVAPARGPMRAVTGRNMERTDAGGFRSVRTGYFEEGEAGPRQHAVVSDVFDLMLLQSRKAHVRHHGEDAPWEPPFSKGQISAARDYAALTERVAASGVSCASLEAVRGGGTGDREVAIFRDIQRLRALHARIGDGLVKEVRRVRPSRRGKAASAIRARTLVDQVCLGQMSVAHVLARHGWSAKDDRSLRLLREGLCAALDRMQGYM